jgi:RHS repeat-associated protein
VCRETGLFCGRSEISLHATTSFTPTYDAVGKRVKATLGGNTYAYVGEWYKVGPSTRKYYTLGGVRVAMNDGGTVRYLLSDHLGSTAVQLSTSLVKEAEVRYDAWGSDRYTSGTMQTSYRYTGQRSDAGIGLYYYGARYYDPLLGRFSQPDTIVPMPGNPQTLNRYTYTLNNPVLYRDPTGHDVCIGPFCVPVPSPEDVIAYGLGAVAQWADDVSMGAYSALVVGNLDSYDSEAFQQGREFGRQVSTAQAEFELATGLGVAAAAMGALGPTGGLALAAAIPSGGTSTLVGGAALTAEAAAALGGVTVAGHGTGMLLKMRKDPLDKGGTKAKGAPSPNQVNELVKKGKAPKGIGRVDTARVKWEQTHIEVNGGALNIDGTWKHMPDNPLTEAQKDWLLQQGWMLPD